MDGSHPAPVEITEAHVAQWVMSHLVGLHDLHPHVSVAVADAFLEAAAPAWPSVAPMLEDAQSEADWWAEFATGTMVTAMLSACLKRLAKGRMIMAPNARKRAMVAIWNSLDEKDRAAFLTYAEPGPAGKT